MDDIVPGLLEDMTNDFQSQYDSSSKIKSLKEKLDKGEATYKEANEYAAEVGGITKNVYSEHLTSDNLPDGKCYYNIAERVTSQTLHDQYELVADYSEKVQTDLNKKAGIGLKAQRADENTEEYHSLANYMSSAEKYDDVSKSTAQSAERIAKETVDNSVKKNAEFQSKAGLKPKIVRNGGNDCCSWCAEVTGTYDYPNVPKDIYKRHNNCTCTVEYDPGSGKRQDVWSKKWISAEEVEQRENLKTLGLDDTNKSAKIEQRKSVGIKDDRTQTQTHINKLISGQKSDRTELAESVLKDYNVDGVKVSIKQTLYRGYCDLENDNGIMKVTSFNLQQDDDRSIEYQIKTIFHEAYHASINGHATDAWIMDTTKWMNIEDVFAESSAHYSASQYGITDLAPAYASKLVSILPRLKQLDEFSSCNTISDFGKVALEKRMAGGNCVLKDLATMIDSKSFDYSEYTKQYFGEIRSDVSGYIEKYLENSPNLASDKIYYIDTLNKAMDNIDYYGFTLSNEESALLNNAIAIAMNRIGVK